MLRTNLALKFIFENTGCDIQFHHPDRIDLFCYLNLELKWDMRILHIKSVSRYSPCVWWPIAINQKKKKKRKKK